MTGDLAQVWHAIYEGFPKVRKNEKKEEEEEEEEERMRNLRAVVEEKPSCESTDVGCGCILITELPPLITENVLSSDDDSWNPLALELPPAIVSDVVPVDLSVMLPAFTASAFTADVAVILGALRLPKNDEKHPTKKKAFNQENREKKKKINLPVAVTDDTVSVPELSTIGRTQYTTAAMVRYKSSKWNAIANHKRVRCHRRNGLPEPLAELLPPLLPPPSLPPAGGRWRGDADGASLGCSASSGDTNTTADGSPNGCCCCCCCDGENSIVSFMRFRGLSAANTLSKFSPEPLRRSRVGG